MKLEYKILWFENDRASFVARQRLVKRVVEKLGFYFPEPTMEADSSNIETLDFQSYDLIIADLNLDNDEKGSKILNAIREKGIYTEVIFYSSEGEEYVRNELSKYKIDGAYCANREVDDFIEKVEKVIHTTVKKVQDLNNMRGLILAETSDIDKTMLSIIKEILAKDAFGIKEKLTEKIFTNVGEKVSGKKSDFDTYFEHKNINRVLKDTVMFDAFERLKILQFIFDSIEHEISNPHKNDIFKTNYSEITRKRNLLGHEIPSPIEGKIIIGSGDSAFEFNDEFCIEMRKKVKKHGDDLDELFQLVITL